VSFTVPLGIALLALGLGNIYVGWSRLRNGNVPQQVLASTLLRLVLTEEWLPRHWRLPPSVAGVVQIVTGTGLAFIASAMTVLGFLGAFR
jgi:hypothetical protein